MPFAVPFALVIALGAAAAPARPAAPKEAVASRKVVVGLTGVAAPFSAERCAGALRGHVDGALAVVPVVGEPYAWSRRAAAEPDVRTVLWLDVRTPGPHRLYLYAAAADRVYVREIAEPGDADALLESLGVVIHALLEAVAAGEAPAGMRPVEETVAPPEPETVEPEAAKVEAPPAVKKEETKTERVAAEVAIAYLGRSLAAAAPWQSGVGGRVAVVAPGGLVASIGGGWLAPGQAAGEVTLALRRLPFDATIGYRFRRARKLAIDVAASATIERLAWSVTGPTEARAVGATQALRVAVGPVVGIVWRVWRGLQVRSAVRLDGWVRDVRLQVATPDGTRPTLAPSPVSAGLDVGLGWGF